MKKIVTMVLTILSVLSLTACGQNQQPVSGDTVQIANPYITCQTREEMTDLAGFAADLPESLPQWVTETIYRTIPGELIEVICQGENNEIRVRIAEGSEDISGVYDSDHVLTWDVQVQGNTVHIKGEEGVVFVSTWNTEQNRTYSVTSTQGVAQEEMLEILNEVR